MADGVAALRRTRAIVPIAIGMASLTFLVTVASLAYVGVTYEIEGPLVLAGISLVLILITAPLVAFAMPVRPWLSRRQSITLVIASTACGLGCVLAFDSLMVGFNIADAPKLGLSDAGAAITWGLTYVGFGLAVGAGIWAILLTVAIVRMYDAIRTIPGEV